VALTGWFGPRVRGEDWEELAGLGDLAHGRFRIKETILIFNFFVNYKLI
jgi:hypothetical protein